MITVGFPVLNRYDLAPLVIESAMRGTIKPDKFLIVDNGGNLDINTLNPMGAEVQVYKPPQNLGVAASWNYLIKNSSEHRIIVNDDIQFCPDTIEKMIGKLNDGFQFVWTCRPFGVLNGFSCYSVKDSVIDKIGYFDEALSPGYAYFEDNDFHYRMWLAGIIEEDSGAEAIHKTSSTMKMFTFTQRMEHDAKFDRARTNYITKWGGLPLQETYREPHPF